MAAEISGPARCSDYLLIENTQENTQEHTHKTKGYQHHHRHQHHQPSHRRSREKPACAHTGVCDRARLRSTFFFSAALTPTPQHVSMPKPTEYAGVGMTCRRWNDVLTRSVRCTKNTNTRTESSENISLPPCRPPHGPLPPDYPSTTSQQLLYPTLRLDLPKPITTHVARHTS